MAGLEDNPNLAYKNNDPSAGAPSCGDVDMKKLEDILARFDVSIVEANDLVILQDYEVVVIADDSGSMLSGAAPADMRVLGQKVISRWDELKTSVAEIVNIASCFDDSGIDIFFLNRPPVTGILSGNDPRFVEAFEKKPEGATPLTETLERVANKVTGERPILMFIFTDGEPNGGKDKFISALRKLVDRTGKKLRVQIMACTHDEEEIGWLNMLDHECNVDVTDDYYAERKEVLRAGLAPRFTQGDWCLKAMIGAVSPKFDKWDETLGGPTTIDAVQGPKCDSCALQ